MFRLLIALIVLVSANALQRLHDREFYEEKFIDHVKEHGIDFKFDGHEFIERLEVFASNMDMIEHHNKGGASFKMAPNAFTHMTWAEFQAHFNIGGANVPNLRRGDGSFYKSSGSNPSSVDWVSAGAVTNVKDQGQCGSCWSFSTTGSIEGAYEIKYGTLKSFSEQQLVDCDRIDSGCNGGWMDRAFGYVKRTGGLCTEEDYPYTSGTTTKAGTCQDTCTKDPKSVPQSYTDVTPGSVSDLESAAAKQPVAIAVAVNNAFQFYSSGVFDGNCGSQLNHGVLLVGYGTDSGSDFWKVKNSWGSSWGESGYIRISKGDDNLCHIMDAPSYPNL
jgi:hypothetical protein